MTQIVKARIENGVVVEAFLLLQDKVPERMASWTNAPIEVGIGWQYDGENFTPPPPQPDPVPASLSFAQLLIGLVSEQWITVEEGRAWRDRTGLPAQVQAVISLLPKEHQFAAETRALAPSEVLRSDPLVAAMGMAAGKTEEEMDEFFRKYAGV